MKRLSYVILHYQVIEDTIECVSSILKLNKEDINQHIIIVDNASPNGSGLRVKKKFENFNNIEVILSKKNVGFAKGNNLGCFYAINNLNPDFLIVLNNDIVINQYNFQQEIVQISNESEFDILGPDIISMVDNLHQSPVKYAITTRGQIVKELILLSFLFTISLVLLDQKFMYWRSKIKSKNNPICDLTMPKPFAKGVKIHGAAIIFSKSYFNIFNNVFFDKTFMYMEEDILLKRALNNNLNILYKNDIVVYHKEDSATNSIYGEAIKKRRFVYKNSIQSLVEYYKAFKKI